MCLNHFPYYNIMYHSFYRFFSQTHRLCINLFDVMWMLCTFVKANEIFINTQGKIKWISTLFPRTIFVWFRSASSCSVSLSSHQRNQKKREKRKTRTNLNQQNAIVWIFYVVLKIQYIICNWFMKRYRQMKTLKADS